MAPRPAWRLALLATAASRAVCVQPQALQDFFTSPKGLDMSTKDSVDLANKEVKTLTACGVTVPMLQALRDSMFATTKLNLPLNEVRSNLLPLAYQHVPPDHLNTLYQTLSGTVGIALPKKDAQTNAMGLAMEHAEPYLLQPLFSNLFRSSSVGLARSQAQQLAIGLTAAGADAKKLLASFLDAVRRMGKDAALKVAIADAVDGNLQGYEARYAKDGKPYVAKEFQTYFGDQWLAEWRAAPKEKRTSDDGKDYRASEFLEFFGGSWSTRWAKAPRAIQRRIAADGTTYTLEEFQAHYGTNAWQAQWAKAYEVPDVCAGLNHDLCDKQPLKCTWQWTGDWTTSCVVKPLASDLVVV